MLLLALTADAIFVGVALEYLLLEPTSLGVDDRMILQVCVFVGPSTPSSLQGAQSDNLSLCAVRSYVETVLQYVLLSRAFIAARS